jgi:steroid delta-isomerase-like uncharacterized protein
MTQENKSLVCAFVEAVNAQDWKRTRALLAPDFQRHSVAAGQIKSAEELITFLQAEYLTFPDANELLLDLVAEGSKVAARQEFSGTQLGPMGVYPATGRVLRATYLAIYRISNGVIAESWAEWDNLAGLRQLGHHSAA